MLTSDLVRTRVRKGLVHPTYLSASREDALEKSTRLVDVFSQGIGQPRGVLAAQIDEIVGYGTDFFLWRGLSKLLTDRSTFETIAETDPVTLRRAIFEASTELGPVTDPAARDRVLAHAAGALGISLEGCFAGMYADLEDRQILTAFKAIAPLDLIHRYNLALAQAVLYKATSLEITLPDPNPNQLRYLFQSLKFFRLMHRAWRTTEGYKLEIDGPASLFSKSRKYGLQMATFLPALVATDAWSMRAELDWERGKEHALELDADAGLISHYTMRGQWLSQDEKNFETRFAKKGEGWTLERRGAIHELDRGEVLVSDYVMTDAQGREVFVEILGFWRKSYLERRISMLDHLDGVPLVMVVSERLKADRDALDAASPAVVFYKGVILVDRVLDAARHVLADVGAER